MVVVIGCTLCSYRHDAVVAIFILLKGKFLPKCIVDIHKEVGGIVKSLMVNSGVTLAVNVNGLVLSVGISNTGSVLLDSLPSLGSQKKSSPSGQLNFNPPSVSIVTHVSAPLMDLVKVTSPTFILQSVI